jgi:ribose transport system permease protein
MNELTIGEKGQDNANSPSAQLDARQFRLRDYIVYIGFFLILVFFAVVLRDTSFLTLNNLMSIIRQTSPITVMAVGMVFVLSTGEIDLSIGSTVAVSSLTAALTLRATDSVIAAIAASLAIGILIGLFNGLVTVKLRVPSFLVTLGSLSILAGLARAMTALDAIPITNATFKFWLGSGSIGPVSILFIWSGLVVIVGHFLYRNTRFGRQVLATGGNKDAALALGIRTGRVKIAALVLAASTAAMAGMLYAGRLHGARYTLGENDLLTVLAAVVIGGTTLFGGRGSVIGALTGSIIMGMLNNGLVLMGLAVSEQMMVRGAIIIIAVALSLREERN